jgi:hypothetical protein
MSKEQEKQLHKTVSTLLRQVPPPMSPCKETTLQDSPERADPLQLYEMETMAGNFTQPNSQQLLTTRM